MNLALWVVAGLLAAVYLGAGLMKATQPKEKLRKNLPWVDDFSARTVRFIGVAEIAGALGLVLPQLTGIAPVLTPIAAVGLVIVQALAIRTHLRRGEKQVLPANAALLLLALFVAVGRLAGL
ncbi:DoxX family protein [uncultured Cellulomonas sp.]|uniref:DoxX family protein n=1 Tax=uncultured Cellulomonas sp. TaxID=189682 RepID=UPI0028ECF328|nr:DoxX family protein [uncultured Cellulomonas sp.]